ncbi:MAG: esterase-like activity of phytase family protein, partial [Zavarzinia sp.]|nr:esterase-like activity of phytase family protein [Zavarzinia sp.]
APVRITAIDVASGRPLRQIAYQPDAVPRTRRLPGPQMNGVSEILADGPHHLLVLERAYSAGAGFAARLYRIDTREGSDTLALDTLAPGNHRPAPKTLVADLSALGIAPDNIEGMAWGAPLRAGARGSGCVLVFVSDDNFNPAQVTQFIAAEYLPLRGGHERCGTTGSR